MLIKEFRVTLPMTVSEYQVAQLFCVAEVSLSETGGGEGVEIIQNEPFKNVPLLSGQFNEGQYTKKIYHLASKIPHYFQALAPKGSLEFLEEAWNAYPYCKTVITNPLYMKKNLHVEVKTLHLADRGESPNVHQLPPDLLRKREIVRIDIANDCISRGDYRQDHDPKLYKSEKTNRGPLVDRNWAAVVEPVMTAYKLVTIECVWWGLQTILEKQFMSYEQRIFLRFHRQVFTSTDKWYGMSMEDIRRIESEAKSELEVKRRESGLRGTVESKS